MPNTLILYEKNGAVVKAGFNEGKMTSFDIEACDNAFKIGNIYVGRVSKVLLHMKAAYVDIGMSTLCYMEMNDGFNYITDKIHPDGELHVGDNILVQIQKDAIRKKPVTVTPEISVSNKLFFIKYSNNKGISFSSKIKDGEFKKKKKADFMYLIPDNINVLFRTNSYDATDEELVKELESDLFLIKEIIKDFSTRTAKTLLYRSVPDYIVELRDLGEIKYDKIITDSPDIYIKLKDFLNERYPNALNKLDFYSDKVLSLENLFDMRKKISEITGERVWLKSGAHIVIQETEALVSIDINTAKASANKQNFKEGFMKINLEAAEEIFKQLELRDLSGIIVIDFINMKGRDSEVFYKKLVELSYNYKGITIVDITKLGLVEITRSRIRQPVKELVKKYKLLDSYIK